MSLSRAIEKNILKRFIFCVSECFKLTL